MPSVNIFRQLVATCLRLCNEQLNKELGNLSWESSQTVFLLKSNRSYQVPSLINISTVCWSGWLWFMLGWVELIEKHFVSNFIRQVNFFWLFRKILDFLQPELDWRGTKRCAIEINTHPNRPLIRSAFWYVLTFILVILSLAYHFLISFWCFSEVFRLSNTF